MNYLKGRRGGLFHLGVTTEQGECPKYKILSICKCKRKKKEKKLTRLKHSLHNKEIICDLAKLKII